MAISTPFKLIGTISLGVLTGGLASLSLVTVPTILGLPSNVSASQVLGTALNRVKGFLYPLEIVATSSFIVSYILSSPRTRHPYLLYASIGGLGVVPYTRFVMAGLTQRVLLASSKTNDVNGEQLDRDLQAWRIRNFGRVAISGIGFALAVLGGYGDTFSD